MWGLKRTAVSADINNLARILAGSVLDKRPKCVDKKQRIGDWEGDTIVGKDHKSALLTLVERKSLFTIIIKLEDKTAEGVAKAATRHLSLIKYKI